MKIRKIKNLYVEKVFSDEEMEQFKGEKLEIFDIPDVIRKDINIYTIENGVETLLCKFRKNIINNKNIDVFKQNISITDIKRNGYGSMTDSTRQGEKSKIFGFYDKPVPGKPNLYKINKKCRFTSLSYNYPEKHNALVPIVKNIDYEYEKLTPDIYINQLNMIDENAICIEDTVFSTVTINVDFQTPIHKDSNDYREGMGNLSVIEYGEYEGGFLVFPQYGIYIDVREGDLLLMNVHEWHCNSPILGEGRVSLVCYLREGMVSKQ